MHRVRGHPLGVAFDARRPRLARPLASQDGPPGARHRLAFAASAARTPLDYRLGFQVPYRRPKGDLTSRREVEAIDGTRTAILGAIAGFTIFLGLPLGRLHSLSARLRAFLAVFSAGILLFLFWDVLTQAFDILEGALTDARAGGPWGPFALRALMIVAGFSVGAFGLACLEGMVLRRRRPAPMAGGSVLVAAEAGRDPLALVRRAERGALTLGMLIALAIGLHNFSEGLAIGVSAQAGEIGLATTLIVGFALHNATEGFGIVGPLGGVRPSWRWLALARSEERRVGKECRL